MRLRYFASLREIIGVGEEEREIRATTVAELLDEVAAFSEAHEAALADRAALRVALDQELAAAEDRIGTAREVAIFPPMTGG